MKKSFLVIMSLLMILSIGMVSAKVDMKEAFAITPVPSAVPVYSNAGTIHQNQLAVFDATNSEIINSDVMSNGRSIWTSIGGSVEFTPSALFSATAFQGSEYTHMFEVHGLTKDHYFWVDGWTNVYTDGKIVSNALETTNLYVDGNVLVTGNLDVEGCIRFNGGILGTCV